MYAVAGCVYRQQLLGIKALQRGLSSLPRQSSPGLFSLEGLHNPSDFFALTKEAIRESDDLRSSVPTCDIRSKTQAVQVLYQLDQISKTVCNVIDAAELCRSAHVSSQWRDAASAAFSELSNYIGTLNGDQRLYQSLATIAESPYFQELTEEEQRFTFLLKREFELDGIHLPDGPRHRVQEVHHHITQLESLFLTNITHSQTKFSVEAALVESVIPRQVLETHGAQYQSDGASVQLTADSPITNSILSFAAPSDLRRQVYVECMNATPENREVLDALRLQRHQLAEALDFASYGDRFLQDKMVQRPDLVRRFLQSLQEQTAKTYQREMEILSNMKHQLENDKVIEAWDTKYYAKLFRAQSGVDPNELASYLSLSNCLSALQLLVGELFGIQMNEETILSAERWDVDQSQPSPIDSEERIRKFVFHDVEGKDLGTMYLDLHPRPGKYTHAAHFTVRCGCLKNGRESEDDYQRPIVALVCNMNSGQASFSSHQEVETLFHEFGHALHSLLSRTKFQHLAGTRGAMDFVETPSHWMENFVWDPSFLPILARNTSGEPISQEMTQSVVTSRHQLRCLEMQSQVVLSMFDQEIFGHPPPTLSSRNSSEHSTQETWSSLHRRLGVPYAGGSHWYTNVGHLVTYGAGYYSYLYSQTFADSIWRKIFEKAPMSRTAGEQVLSKLLVHGGARDPKVILKDILGRSTPTIV